MYTLKAKNSNSIFNLNAQANPIKLSETVIQSINANSVSGSIPSRGDVEFSGTGNFIFNGTPKSLADVTGIFFSLNLNFDGIFSQTETWSDGANVQGITNDPYLYSLLSGNDYFEGSSTHTGGDQVKGLDGNDSFKGYGDGLDGDYFVGGDGVDTSIYRGKKSDYSIKTDTPILNRIKEDGSRISGLSVTDGVKSRDGTDYLIEVERLQFSDRTIALDISGIAGQAYRVYQAAFNRTPDNGGLKYWIGLMDSGVSLSAVSSAFIASAEFKALYGVNPTNEVFISKLYDNVLHRAPDLGGYSYWIYLLNTGVVDNISTLINFSESAENKAGVIGVIQNGIDLLN
jgi:hypothetical protein